MGEIIKTKNKGEYEVCQGTEVEAIGNMMISSLRQTGGRPPVFQNNEQGLEDFRRLSIEFFENIARENEQRGADEAVIPDIELWSGYLGLTRMTLLRYEKRGSEWAETIQYFKNLIAAFKKQLGLRYKIPPMVFAFDMANNHGYHNTNEFKLTADFVPTKEQSERQQLEQEIADNGLVWNETTGEFEEKR